MSIVVDIDVLRRGLRKASLTILSGDTLLWIHDHGKWRILGVDPAGEQVRQFDKPVLSYGAIWDGVFDNRGRYWRDDSHSDGGLSYPPPAGWSSSTWRRYYKSYDLSSGAIDSVYLGERSYRSFYAHYRDSNGRLQWLTPGFQAYEATVVNPSGGFWRANSAAYRIARTGEGGDTLVVIEAGVPAPPVTDEDRAAYIEEAVEDGPEARRAAEEVAALMPEVKPVLARMCGRQVRAPESGEIGWCPPSMPGDRVQPDLLFVSDGRREIIGEKQVLGAPDLGIPPVR